MGSFLIVVIIIFWITAQLTNIRINKNNHYKKKLFERDIKEEIKKFQKHVAFKPGSQMISNFVKDSYIGYKDKNAQSLTAKKAVAQSQFDQRSMTKQQTVVAKGMDQLQHELKKLNLAKTNDFSVLDKQFIAEFRNQMIHWVTISQQDIKALLLNLERIFKKNQLTDMSYYKLIQNLLKTLTHDDMLIKEESALPLDDLESTDSLEETIQVANLSKKQVRTMKSTSVKQAVIWKEILDKPKCLR